MILVLTRVIPPRIEYGTPKRDGSVDGLNRLDRLCAGERLSSACSFILVRSGHP
jgi:hypothetical protein